MGYFALKLAATRRKLGLMDEIERINKRLGTLSQRLQELAELEARAAPVRGMAARGILDPERQRIIEETDTLLDRWDALLKAQRSQGREAAG